MGGAKASVQASVATTVWMLLWRLAYGGACVVDGVSKLGIAFTGPVSRGAGDFQPSPLGPVSALLELAFGALLLVGFEARASVVVLAVHVGLGMLLATARHEHVAFEADTFMTGLVLVLVLVFGAGQASVDGIWPEARLLPKLLRKLRGREQA
jgi:uncharacterized membrane protein YphA (DoxX/SURF4 family)